MDGWAMENEPIPKRRRTASPPLAQGSTINIQPPILPPNTILPRGEDDKAYQLYLERAFADPRFRSTVAQIFNKYDGKSAQAYEDIDPNLCGTSTADSNPAGPPIETQLGSLGRADHLPYHLDIQQCEPKDENAETADHHAVLNEAHGSYAPGTAPLGYVPAFSGGGMPPGIGQSWYGNPFQGPGTYPSQWDGFPGQLTMPNGSVTAGPWMAPETFAYNSSAWPPHAMQPPPATCQIDPALEMFAEAKTEEETYHFVQADESTGNYQPATEHYFDALGRKRRRRLAQPRFSKNGKRLGRPPKSAEELGISADTGAYDGEGEEDENTRVVDLKPPTSEFCDDDDDTLWGELAEALQLASKATSKKRSSHSTKPSQNGGNSATESDGAVEADKDPGQGETMLRKIQQELVDRAVRRSMAKDNGDDTDAAAEGRRRSGRERKPANFGEQISWDKVSAERRTSYKIKMHLRALSVQARRERKKKEKEEAEVAAKEKEEAEKAKREKQEAEDLATSAAAADKDTEEGSGEAMPSTIPDSQDTVTSLPIRTTPKKPQSTQIMRQTTKNHVNSVVHFEEDDEGLSDNEAPVTFTIKNPVFSLKKPEIRVHSFLGENYIDTVYALSDDEAPTLLASMKRVSLCKKKKPQLGPADVMRHQETDNAPRQYSSGASKQTTTGEVAERHVSTALSPSPCVDTDTALDPVMDTQAMTELPCKPGMSDEATRSSIPSGGDGDDSGIDIRSEQASSEQADRLPARDPVPAAPLFRDQNLLGAEYILDSLDVMSATEETPSSPVSEYGLAKEDTQMNDIAAFTNNVPVLSRSADKPMFVNEESMYESMDIFEDLAADIPPITEELEMEYDEPGELTVEVLEQSTTKEKSVEKGTEQGPPKAQKEPINALISPPQLNEDDIDAEEYTGPFPPETASVSPPARLPLPPQSKLQRSSARQSLSSLNSKTPTQKATSKEPSPSSTGERSRLPSSSSSRTPAPDSKSGRVRKGSLSARRSLLSLTGGEDDIESLLKRKPTVPAAKSTHSATPLPPYSSSRKLSAPSSFGSTSRRKSKPPSSASSLTRLSLGSLPSLSRDKSRSSKERQETKERRRKSASATPSTTASVEVKGTCGVDGYTCGRDFCFTCL